MKMEYYLNNLSPTQMQDFILHPDKPQNKYVYDYYGYKPLITPTIPYTVAFEIPSYYKLHRKYPFNELQELENLRCQAITEPADKELALKIVNKYIASDPEVLNTENFAENLYRNLLQRPNLEYFDIIEPFNGMYPYFAQGVVSCLTDDDKLLKIKQTQAYEILFDPSSKLRDKKYAYALLRRDLFKDPDFLS